MSSPALVARTNEIVITRVFNAPSDLVWAAWTEREHIEKWFGPKGFSTRVAEHDLEVGGRSTYVMIGPDGKEFPGSGVFREIVPKKRIVSTDEFGDEYDELLPNTDLPSGMILTAEFAELGERTKLTLTISHPNAEERKKHEEMGVVDGWNSSFECLDDYLAELTSSS